MENKVIKLSLGDWLWNASITGFINIVGEENVTFEGNTAKIPAKCLDDFEEKYFKYFINTYERNLPWYKVVFFRKIMEDYREKEFENLNLEGLKRINEYIKETAKKYVSSNSFKSAFQLMGDEKDIETLEKKLQKIKEPKDEESFEQEKSSIIEEVKIQFEILDEIIEYCGSEKGRRFIGAKNVIYSIIKNGWEGVSFLNPQTKIKDVYEDYRKYFVEEANEYLKNTKLKYKYSCFTCGAPIKDFKNDMSFVNQAGFDVARKLSHVWNFVNDVAVCPLCKLIYSCLPAGFVYIGNLGLYINANMNMEHNMNININVKELVFKEANNELSPRRIYKVLIEALIKQQLERGRYELADVQLVRYENGSYRFNLLPESTIELIEVLKGEIENLIRTGYREGKESFSIYEHVLEHVFNNRNLFLLVNKLLHYKLSSPKDCFFHTGHIVDMLKINVQLIKNLGGLENMGKDWDGLKDANLAGYILRKAYLEKDPKTGKIPGISYRLLNALKTGNRSMFMDVLLNCYLYVGKEVPKIIPEVLRDDDEAFSTIGYAFVSGLIEGKKEEKELSENGKEIKS